MSDVDPGTWDIFKDITAINAWIDEANEPSEHEDSMRIMKIGEEYGEAVAAYIGMTGQNPRKGLTHTQHDVLMELADIAITALTAIEHFVGKSSTGPYTRMIMASKIQHIMKRIDDNRDDYDHDR